MHRTRSFVAALAVALALTAAAAAQDPPATSVRSLVEEYLTSLTARGVGEAAPDGGRPEGLERQIEDAGRRDPRAIVARMIGAARRRDYAAINRMFATLPESFRLSPFVLKIKILGSIGAKDDNGAQREMVLLIHVASADDPAKPAGETSRRAAGFAGRVFGFLAGPANRPQPELENGVVERLTPANRPAFDAGREQVLEHAAALESLVRDAREAAKLTEKDRCDEQLASLAAERQEITEQLAPLEENLKQSRAAIDAELLSFARERDLCLQRQFDMNLAIQTVRDRIPGLKQDIDGHRQTAADPDTPSTRRDEALAAASKLEQNVVDMEADLALRGRNYLSIGAEVLALDAKMAQARSRTDPLRKTASDLRQKLGALERRERELRAAPILGDAPDVVAMQNHVQSLDTYLPGCWETAKARLMKSFE